MEEGLCLEKNLGTVDRGIRTVLAVLLITGPVLAGWSVWTIALLGAFGGFVLESAINGY